MYTYFENKFSFFAPCLPLCLRKLEWVKNIQDGKRVKELSKNIVPAKQNRREINCMFQAEKRKTEAGQGGQACVSLFSTPG